MPLAADKGRWGAQFEGQKTAAVAITANASSSPDEWKQWNSPNHGGLDQGEGQNVLFADSHVDWAAKPTVGVGNDNIYTTWTNTTAGSLDSGRVITATGTEAPYGETDSVIYP